MAEVNPYRSAPPVPSKAPRTSWHRLAWAWANGTLRRWARSREMAECARLSQESGEIGSAAAWDAVISQAMRNLARYDADDLGPLPELRIDRPVTFCTCDTDSAA